MCLNILTSWMLCGSVVLLNENIWPLCKSSTLAVTPFMFFVHKYHFVDKYLTNIFSLNLWPVSYLSQAASDGFNQNWTKSGPFLFVVLEIINAMDRPIVQWFNSLYCGTLLWIFCKKKKSKEFCCAANDERPRFIAEGTWTEWRLWWTEGVGRKVSKIPINNKNVKRIFSEN